MAELEQEIRRRFLDRLDENTWIDDDPRLDFGVQALPYFIAAFDKESVPAHRARLVRIIWQFRELAALPALAIALSDQVAEVWKDALDGIVTLGGDQSLAILNEARTTMASRSAEAEKLAWIHEAADQIAEAARNVNHS